MAVVLVFRVALVVTAGLVRWCTTYNCDVQQWLTTASRFAGELLDPAKDPATLTTHMSADIAAGTEGTGGAVVTDFTGTFELRKLQWRFSRAPTGLGLEDVDVCTFHFIKASGGVPGTYNDSVDLAAVETAIGAYTNTLKAFLPPWTHSDQFRWYKDGPAFYAQQGGAGPYLPIGGNAAIRITEVDVAGTGSSSSVLPPQTAITVTERTSSRRHWGRFYLPAFASSTADPDGRLASGNMNTLLGAVVTMYNACRAASMFPVVWSIQKPERPKKPSGVLPPWPATAFEVTSLQMDNIFDVIRSRRFATSTAKTNTALT